MARKNRESLHFEKLAEKPAKSENGVESFCMKKIEEIAKDRECRKVETEVYEPSQHEIAFYTHKGYRIVGKEEILNIQK